MTRRRARVPMMMSRVPTMDTRTAPRPPKTADPIYNDPRHRVWAAQVIERAGGRCEWVEKGVRCWRKQPEYRVVGDHIVEVKDGGALFDPNNGQCLCVAHNTRKGLMARAKRMAE